MSDQTERDTPPDPWEVLKALKFAIHDTALRVADRTLECDQLRSERDRAHGNHINALALLGDWKARADAAEAELTTLRAERDTYRNGFDASQQQIAVLLDANADLRQTLERCRAVQQRTAETWRAEQDDMQQQLTTLQQDIAACKPFLTDGETPAECIARNRAEVDWFIEQNHKLSYMHAERVVERDRLQQILAAREQEIACLKGETTP